MLKITLEAARVNAGFSQEDVTKEVNISKTTLVNWEKGRTFPDVSKFEELCNLYGVKKDNIFLNYNSTKSRKKKEGD